MASIPGFSPYPLLSPRLNLGTMTESIFAFLILYLGPSGTRLFPSCYLGRLPRINASIRVPSNSTRHLELPLRPLACSSLPLPLYSSARPSGPLLASPAAWTGSAKLPYILEVCTAIVSRGTAYVVPSGKIQFDDDRLKDETEIKL